jgi:hypothetical protein
VSGTSVTRRTRNGWQSLLGNEDDDDDEYHSDAEVGLPSYEESLTVSGPPGYTAPPPHHPDDAGAPRTSIATTTTTTSPINSSTYSSNSGNNNTDVVLNLLVPPPGSPPSATDLEQQLDVAATPATLASVMAALRRPSSPTMRLVDIDVDVDGSTV